jgi:hypothetical protein
MHAASVQIALHELQQDASVALAAAVRRHQSNALMAIKTSGAKTVVLAERTLHTYFKLASYPAEHRINIAIIVAGIKA